MVVHLEVDKMTRGGSFIFKKKKNFRDAGPFKAAGGQLIAGKRGDPPFLKIMWRALYIIYF
jgi:hypothetical protein